MTNVTCAIIMKEGQILTTQRSEKMKLPLKWEFPGGKIEDSETEAECLLREIKEELNIDIKLNKRLDSKIYHYHDFTINLIPYIAEYLSGEILLVEHKEFKWLKPEQLTLLDWAPADIPIVNDFLNFYYERIRPL
ncbi:MAG: (deoxy)nucleoside triphosphate pyrophosphohydrolase [Lentimicrobium sp.]|nr:(deoxy)nucleoside triphosphate pyrophosphohydrolase [Lentimicrobium sp.]